MDPALPLTALAPLLEERFPRDTRGSRSILDPALFPYAADRWDDHKASLPLFRCIWPQKVHLRQRATNNAATDNNQPDKTMGRRRTAAVYSESGACNGQGIRDTRLLGPSPHNHCSAVVSIVVLVLKMQQAT